jgi:hypothetical protein
LKPWLIYKVRHKKFPQQMLSSSSQDDIEQVSEWVSTVTGLEVKATNINEFHETLSSGIILVHLINSLTKQQLKIHNSALPFKQMENIAVFLREIEKLEVPSFEQFQTVDLYEKKNIGQVVRCLISLSRMAHKKGLCDTLIGPKLVEKNIRAVKQFREVTVPLLTKHTSKAGTVVFGGKRQIGGVYEEGGAECVIDDATLNGIRG